jgi:hypothetical protein
MIRFLKVFKPLEEVEPPLLSEVSHFVECCLGEPQHIYTQDNYCVVDMKYYFDSARTIQLHSMIQSSSLLFQSFEIRLIYSNQTTIMRHRSQTTSTMTSKTAENLVVAERQRKRKGLYQESSTFFFVEARNCIKNDATNPPFTMNNESPTYYHVLKTIEIYLGKPLSVGGRHDHIITYVNLYRDEEEATRFYEILQSSPLLLNDLELRLKVI